MLRARTKFETYRFLKRTMPQWSMSNLLIIIMIYMLGVVFMEKTNWVLAGWILITGPIFLFLLNWRPAGYEVEIPTMMWTVDGKMVTGLRKGMFDHWIKEMCQGDYLEIGETLLFELEEDAVALKMWVAARMEHPDASS